MQTRQAPLQGVQSKLHPSGVTVRFIEGWNNLRARLFYLVASVYVKTQSSQANLLEQFVLVLACNPNGWNYNYGESL